MTKFKLSLTLLTGLCCLLILDGCKAKGKRNQEVLDILPEDGVYSLTEGKGGPYKDRINGYFEVQVPAGFRIRERRDKSEFTITDGSSHVGEVVPASFIQFISGEKAYIAVTARKTFTMIEHDFESVLNELPTKFTGIRVHRSRFVTIDGAKGGEVLASWRGQTMLMVKYKKYGLDHGISMNCSTTEAARLFPVFVAFLQSYRGLRSG